MKFDFSRIFNTFSRRPKPQEVTTAKLSSEFRARVLLLCRDSFYSPTFWEEMHKILQYLHGRPSLTDRSYVTVPDDAVLFLQNCSDEHFLDFVEKIFSTQAMSDHRVSERDLVKAINEFLGQDNLPYTVLESVYEKGTSFEFGREMVVHRLVSFPTVICRESEALHELAISPTLSLLNSPSFALANKEFLEALKDYRTKDYGDCVTKCGSALESVMKVICDRNGWSFQQSDTGSALLDTIFSHIELDSFFKQPIMLVATIRNRLSTSHGAGSRPRSVPKHVAQYAINATASAILLMVEETNP